MKYGLVYEQEAGLLNSEKQTKILLSVGEVRHYLTNHSLRHLKSRSNVSFRCRKAWSALWLAALDGMSSLLQNNISRDQADAGRLGALREDLIHVADRSTCSEVPPCGWHGLNSSFMFVVCRHRPAAFTTPTFRSLLLEVEALEK